MLADTYEGALHQSRRTLPPVAQCVLDETWLERLISCFDSLAFRFEWGRSDATRISTCTAEEMALHLTIDAAEGATRGGYGCSIRPSMGSRHPSWTSMSTAGSPTFIHEHGFCHSPRWQHPRHDIGFRTRNRGSASRTRRVRDSTVSVAGGRRVDEWIADIVTASLGAVPPPGRPTIIGDGSLP
jgi:hypothetical protein